MIEERTSRLIRAALQDTRAVDAAGGPISFVVSRSLWQSLSEFKQEQIDVRASAITAPM